jgi:hypothetical protein
MQIKEWQMPLTKNQSITEVNFDWAKAKAAEVGFYYGDDSGNILFSAGKEDWLPIGIAVYIFHEWAEDGYPKLKSAISVAAWLPYRETKTSTWLENNDECLRDFSRLAHNNAILPSEQRKQAFRHPSALAYLPRNMAQAYFSAHDRAYPKIENDIYWFGETMSEDYWLDPDIKIAREAAYRAFEVTKDFAVSWFEVRGFEVNRADRSVKVRGYKPLQTSELLRL